MMISVICVYLCMYLYICMSLCVFCVCSVRGESEERRRQVESATAESQSLNSRLSQCQSTARVSRLEHLLLHNDMLLQHVMLLQHAEYYLCVQHEYTVHCVYLCSNWRERMLSCSYN